MRPAHSPQSRFHCCSLRQTLKNCLSLRPLFPPVNTHIKSHWTWSEGNNMSAIYVPILTSSLCAFICLSISSGLLNCFPRPLWPFLPGTQMSRVVTDESNKSSCLFKFLIPQARYNVFFLNISSTSWMFICKGI